MQKIERSCEKEGLKIGENRPVEYENNTWKSSEKLSKYEKTLPKIAKKCWKMGETQNQSMLWKKTSKITKIDEKLRENDERWLKIDWNYEKNRWKSSKMK